MLNPADIFSGLKIPIVEIFQSISGEGVSAGNVVTFVRVAGCDLRCAWCDTKYSFKESGDGVEMLTADEIADRLEHIGSQEVICTGGEPLEEGKLKRYLPAFIQGRGFSVRIETSGGSALYSQEELDVFKLSKESRPVYTMDVKCPASGMESYNRPQNLMGLDKRDELKFVVANNDDLNYVFNYIQANKVHLKSNQIVLNYSPVFESISADYLVEYLKEKARFFQQEGLFARLSLQIHKYIWPPHQRGV